MATTDRAWVATRKGLFELRRTDGEWRIAHISFLGDPVTQVLPPGDNGEPLLAALNLGHFGVKLHASDDGGVNWREVAVPAYPTQPEGATGPAWKLVQIWSLERGAAGSSSTVWAGTLPGGLFRSNDHGESWSLVESLWQQPERSKWFGGGYDVPGIHSICPGGPAGADELLLGISCGGVWHSADQGASWSLRTRGLHASYMPPEQADDGAIQDPHRLARCAAQPDVIWCQHHNGIWRSTDNAQNWAELTFAPLSHFGFAVAAHPTDPETAWFVPATADENRVPVGGALAVNRTRDGGKSFLSLRSGLPQQHCYDLIYRHGFAVADDGLSLLMGSTTGSLWTSADGGDRWQTLSAHLPPIFAVRFG
jgi:hypothetical protein